MMGAKVYISIFIITTSIGNASMKNYNENVSTSLHRQADIEELPRISNFKDVAVISSVSTLRNGSSVDQLNYAETKALDNRRLRRSTTNYIVITERFPETTVTPGEDISIQCSASGDERPPQFVWERDGLTINTNTDQRYTIGQMMTSDNVVVTHFNITRVRVEDGGLYACVAKKGDATDYHDNRLDIYGPPYIRSRPPVKVQSGESVRLICPFYGYPISKIEWEYKGKSIRSNILQYKRDLRSLNIDGLLIIPEMSKEKNAGVYTCIVTSPSGEMARRAFEIEVVEAPVLEELFLGANLQENQIVQIYCNVKSGDTPINFEWLKDGKRIQSNLKIVERSSELFSALIIKKVALEHCGQYTCVASNHVDKVNRSTELYIKVAPKWLEEPSNSSLLLGRRGTVSCSAAGYPVPQVHWMKKDAILGTWQPVLELAGGGILSVPNGTLIIEEVSLPDEGFYSCNVENGVGQPLSKTVWMSVNKPVHFDIPSLNETVRLGHMGTLKCQPLGDDPIRMSWVHNGNILDFRNPRTKHSESKNEQGVTSTIIIQYTEKNDAGAYQCKANNPYGSAIFQINLNILEPPTPPMELRVSSLESRSVKLSWRDTIRANIQFYTVQYKTEFQYWDRNQSVNVTRQQENILQMLEIQSLQPATWYIARVASGNLVDMSPYTIPVHFTTLEEAPSGPPQLLTVQETERPGEIRMGILPPDKNARNGVIVGYNVKITPHSSVSDSTGNTRIIKAAQYTKLPKPQYIIISGLMKNTRYSVLASAFTNAGVGPFSLPTYTATREGAPETAPSSVECKAQSTSSLRVSWKPAMLSGNVKSVKGYIVLYSTEDGEWQNSTTFHTSTEYLQGLSKFTNYTIKVAGYTAYASGPYSSPIYCSTQEDYPSPPADIKVLVLSSTSLLVSWKKPDCPNGIILYYTVTVSPASSFNNVQFYRVDPEIQNSGGRGTSLEVKDLTEGKSYDIYVTASTKIGESSSTRKITQTPQNKVVAGVSSLGGTLSVGVGSSLLLVCECVGIPPPRTVWYHNTNTITHHPRFTRNHDDSLLINNIDQSLSGNYSCVAKNLYGSDSVEYTVIILPLPESPILKGTPFKDSIRVEWEQPYYILQNKTRGQKISYNLTWKEANGLWKNAWQNPNSSTLSDTRKQVLSELKCGTKYCLRITATNKVGTSQPAYLDVSTLGGVPIPPSSNEWLWSNATQIHIQLAGWDDNGCDLTSWEVEVRPLGSKAWVKVDNKMNYPDYSSSSHLYQSELAQTFSIGDLSPALWYQIKITSTNEAGSVTSSYTYATKTVDGGEIGPPSELFDLNMVVIICSSILLGLCLVCCVYILLRRQRQGNLADSITIDNKSESGNLTTNTSHTNLANVKENVQINCNRIYSAPIHNLRNNTKHELYEISPYAQFAVGFRTFGHVDNQDLPTRPVKQRYDTETSFQVCSESEDSDSISKSTLKSVPRKKCRTPHHK